MNVIFKKQLQRRTFLRGAGSVIALPLLDAMIPALGRADATKGPARMAVVYFPNGAIQPNWWPKGEKTEFELAPTMAPLARDGSFWVKLIVETTGRVVPAGQIVRNEAVVAPATVTFSDTAAAPAGTPQLLRTAKLRWVPVPRIGPPFVETGLRVSTTRQGATAKNENGPVCAEAVAAPKRTTAETTKRVAA